MHFRCHAGANDLVLAIEDTTSEHTFHRAHPSVTPPIPWFRARTDMVSKLKFEHL